MSKEMVIRDRLVFKGERYDEDRHDSRIFWTTKTERGC